MNWTDTRNPQESLAILGQLSETCAILGGGPITGQLLKLVREKDYLTLINYEISYENAEVTDVVYARQILGFYQKLNFLDLGFDKAQTARSRFVQSEQMCLETNRRFKCLHEDPSKFGKSSVLPILHRAARKIDAILGNVPSLGELPFAFGPGANTNVKGALANPRAKLSASLECSANMTSTVGTFLAEVPNWAAHHCEFESEDSYFNQVGVVPGKLVFVPKNARTDRSIVVEPILNSFFQKGVGGYMKQRLLRSGINLYDQSINQRLACQGSVDGSLATVDLSMASDCLARALVFSLLPPEWAQLLDSLRTADVIVHADILAALSSPVGLPLRLEKFSSMGNGYTFELESLIFYGLCFAVCEELGVNAEISVYGDDLIIPVETYDLLAEILLFCGFSINPEKSFRSGSFRESCGADYLTGFDIRPFYQKTQVSDRNLYTMHNWFLRHGEYQLARAVLPFLCESTPPLFGPDGYGDGHLIGTHQLRQNRRHGRDGWDGGYFDTYALKQKAFNKPLPGDALLPTYSVYTRSGALSPTDPDVVRGSAGYAKVSIYTLSRSIFASKL